jgi:hypothetical protein
MVKTVFTAKIGRKESRILNDEVNRQVQALVLQAFRLIDNDRGRRCRFSVVVLEMMRLVDMESTGRLTRGVVGIAILISGPSDQHHLEETGDPGQPRQLDWAIRRDRRDVWPV